MTKAKDQQSKRQADKATHKTKSEIESANERTDSRETTRKLHRLPQKKTREREDLNEAAFKIVREATKD
jgi:hypothetical protein